MIDIVTFDDLKSYKYISDSTKNQSLWPLCVKESQLLDVKTWLGDALLNEIATQMEDDDISAYNTTLLDGGSYTYGGSTYLFQGLKAVLIYYAFSRFVSRAPYNFTQAGITVKESEYSNPAEEKAIQRLSTEAYLTATAIKEEIELYLKRNSVNYPLYACGTSNRRARITAIGD